MFFTNGSTTRRYEPDALAPRCMNNDQDARDGGKPDGDESRRILWIRVHEKVDVVEHCGGLREGYAVLLLVAIALVSSHSNSSCSMVVTVEKYHAFAFGDVNVARPSGVPGGCLGPGSMSSTAIRPSIAGRRHQSAARTWGETS